MAATQVKVRKGQATAALSRAAFNMRFLGRFKGPETRKRRFASFGIARQFIACGVTRRHDERRNGPIHRAS